jgi:hypothetical protein
MSRSDRWRDPFILIHCVVCPLSFDLYLIPALSSQSSAVSYFIHYSLNNLSGALNSAFAIRDLDDF